MAEEEPLVVAELIDADMMSALSEKEVEMNESGGDGGAEEAALLVVGSGGSLKWLGKGAISAGGDKDVKAAVENIWAMACGGMSCNGC